MSRFFYFFLVAVLISGCTRKSPHGRYIARVEMGAMFVEMAYDFRENHAATFWITSNGAAIAAQGRWEAEREKVLFEGISTDPTSKKTTTVSNVLHFDGEDLFRDDLTVRFVHQK